MANKLLSSFSLSQSVCCLCAMNTESSSPVSARRQPVPATSSVEGSPPSVGVPDRRQRLRRPNPGSRSLIDTGAAHGHSGGSGGPGRLQGGLPSAVVFTVVECLRLLIAFRRHSAISLD